MIGTIALWLAIGFVVDLAFGVFLGSFLHAGAGEPIMVPTDRRDGQSVEPSPSERRRAA